LSYETISFRDIPIPLAKKYLEEYIELLKRSGLSVEQIVESMYDYASAFTKCDPDRVGELFEKLTKDIGFKEVTAAMIINIVPTVVDELRTLLQFEASVPEEEVLTKVIEMLKEYCTLE